MSELAEAKAIAFEAHEGQKRNRNGEPYINHVSRVADMCEHPNQKIVAWLHDVLEDNKYWTRHDLLTRGISENIVASVVVLTRKEDESYYDYITRVSEDDLATRVKLADLADNLRDLPPGQKRDKYLLARELLLAITNTGIYERKI